MTKVWVGDWYARIQQRVHERGFESVAAFVASQPTASLLSLADQLGKDDVAALQLEKVLIHEAKQTGSIEHCARDLLVRGLHEELPEGWREHWDKDTIFRRAGALSDWHTSMGPSYADITRRINDELAAADIPRGWLPSDPADPILLRIFERYWREPEQ